MIFDEVDLFGNYFSLFLNDFLKYSSGSSSKMVNKWHHTLRDIDIIFQKIDIFDVILVGYMLT